MDLFAFDETFRKAGVETIAGADEAGRGPLAGPVVAAAVILPFGTRIDGIRDSKKVPAAERERLYDEIVRKAATIGVGRVDASEIDRLNILKATKQAMFKAVSCLSFPPDLLLIDALTLPHLGITQRAIIKGDAKSASVAAASIIAKVVRDRIMIEYHSLYPLYGFDRHKGYGTKDHIERLERHGPCPIHRKTFAPVVSLMLPFPVCNESN